jgi:hypothetical protein
MSDPHPSDGVAAELIETIRPTGDKEKALSVYYDLVVSDAAKKRLTEWNEQNRGDPLLEKWRLDLLPAALLIEEIFPNILRQWPKVFWRAKSTQKDFEQISEHRWTGLAQLYADGIAVVRDNKPGERFVYNIARHNVGLGSSVKRECFPDSVISVRNIASLMMGLAESCVQSEEIIHANILETGRAYNPEIVGDGCPLFSDNHPTDYGNYSNILPPSHLNAAALERAFEQIRSFQDQAGLRIMARPRKLVVPIALEFAACRLTKAFSDFFPEGYQVLDFLKDPNAWFIVTTVLGLRSFEWRPFRLDLKIEEDCLVFEATQSYGAGYTNPRAVLGCFPGRLD